MAPVDRSSERISQWTNTPNRHKRTSHTRVVENYACFLSILENVFFRGADRFFGGGEIALFTKSEFLRLDV
jgi:hypothetical protein